MAVKFVLISNDHKQRAIDYILSQPLEHKLVVEVKPYKSSKTLPQLRTVHMHIREIKQFFKESAGKFFTDDDIKYWLKSLFGIVEIYDTPTGQRKRYKSFADYKIDEMSKLIDEYMAYCVTEFGLYLTLPGYED